MKKLVVTILLLSAFTSKADDWGIFNAQPVARFNITTTTPYKEVYEEALTYYLLNVKYNQINNHFCLIGYDWPDGRRRGVIFWDEGHYLFSDWHLNSEPEDDDYLSLTAEKPIDLKSAVFTPEKLREIYTEEEIRRHPDVIPMYGYRQKSVDQQRRDCDKYGEKIVIDAFERPKDCKDTNDPKEAHLCEAIGE